MERIGLPKEYINWFWTMYRNLGIKIVVNGYLSNMLEVKRGFMEGHPPSMAAFVISMIPLMNKLESVITGITTQDITSLAWLGQD